MPQQLRESTTLAEATTGTAASGRMLVQIITPGWGSSGYYSPQVLEDAATDRLVTRGTAMFLDHASETERTDRPERSVRDIAAVFTEDARWTGTALVAEAQVFAPYRELLTEMAEHIGVSISGSATDIVVGEAEGKRGPVIEGLAEVASVDFVTRAGRGGKVLGVLESAHQRTVAEVRQALDPEGHVNEALPGGMTVEALRQALGDAVRRTYGTGPDSYAYVEDFTDTDVIYRSSGPNIDSALYREGYAVAGAAVTLSGARLEVRAETRYVPVSPAGSTPTQESQEDTMPQIEEARLRQLEEADGRVPVLEAERDTATRERDEARQALAETNARAAARPVVAAVLAEGAAALPASTVARLTETLVASAPLKDGALDEAALRTATAAARTTAEAEVAEALEAAGVGRPRGVGQTSSTDHEGELSESAYDTRSASVFGRPIVKGA